MKPQCVRKTIFKLISLAVMAFASTACIPDVDDTETPDGRKHTTHFKVVIEDAPTTYIHTANDLVTIFNRSKYNDKYIFSGNEGDNHGYLDSLSRGNASPYEPDLVYAVYPYDPEMTIKLKTDGSFPYIVTVLPHEQHYISHSFGTGSNIMVAVSDDDKLSFKNLCGYLKLRLYGNNVSISQIQIKGNSNEKIAGTANIRCDLGRLPQVNNDTFTKTEITLICDTPVELGATQAESTDFWFVIPPITFSNGITITVTDDAGKVFEETTTTQLTVARNTLESMSELEVVPKPGSLSGKIFLAGDSHVARANHNPRYGWGEKLEDELKALSGCTLTPTVVNAAQGGRSSEDFKDNTHLRWQTYIAPSLAKNDLVLIEFAPNDFGQNISLSDYANNLKWYIDSTLEKGAFPVLVTPPNKCDFVNGELQPSPWYEYCDQMRVVASNTNTPLVDIDTFSWSWIKEKGASFDFTGDNSYYLPDHGHLREKGASLYAGFVAQRLRELAYWY